MLHWYVGLSVYRLKPILRITTSAEVSGEMHGEWQRQLIHNVTPNASIPFVDKLPGSFFRARKLLYSKSDA